MDSKDNIEPKNGSGDEESSGVKGNKQKTRGRKRKRKDSESSTDIDDILPENTVEVEKNLIASAVKNNLDDESVKKILKKVVTNEHVFALVKLREEEDEETNVTQEQLRPKITRARMKELMKVSPQTPAWNLELTPIKHIPVKTRPEVKALIAQELPEDEDDEEYEPTHDDVPSDDDQTLESCSDIDSQPRTPATPGSARGGSPRIRQDGPFKVPQELRTPARKRLNLEEEPTIALRTRSKLSLSATPIEHIESSFIPPDDIPAPDIEDPVWNEFVNDILDPSSVSRVEDDDDADPEYNVAADPDAEEDEEALENSIINISKKEINDLFTELLDIMPDTADISVLNEELLIGSGQSLMVWEGKKEPKSEEDIERNADRLVMEKRDSVIQLSVGKTEPQDPDYQDCTESAQQNIVVQEKENVGNTINKPIGSPKNVIRNMKIIQSPLRVHVEERVSHVPPSRLRERHEAPPAVRSVRADQVQPYVVRVEIDGSLKILPEQIQILQQQLRQHVQLSASNFLQLFVNPAHWSLAPCYKEYLMQLDGLLQANPNSVVNVCNLKPAIELVNTWEKTVSEDTPENKKMVEFIQSEAERSRRRFKQSALYVGEFPETFMRVVANSSVFLYPYLLPAMPYRADRVKKFGYRRCEDNLIVLGLDQFWQYVESNPQIYPLRTGAAAARARGGLAATVALVCRHLLPWLAPRRLLLHLQRARKERHSPVCQYFKDRYVEPVKHKLLPYNPNLTLYEQPEHEMPRIWVRYLAKSSKRFRDHLYKRKNSGLPPVEGVPVEFGDSLKTPIKKPLPIDFTKEIVCNRKDLKPKCNEPVDKFDINVQTNLTNNVNNLTQNILVIDNPNATGKVMVLGGLVPVGKVVPSPRKNVDTDVTHSLIPDTNNNPNVSQENPTFIVVTEEDDRARENAIKHDQVLANYVVNGSTKRQMFKLVETSTGGFLVPMNVDTNTVNSINRPITTVKENISIQKGTNTQETNDIENKNHCRCCILLKKICKGKQKSIKDFFKPNNRNETKPCECTHKTYPKISKRLQMLIENYKMKSWCVFRELNNKINEAKSEKENTKNQDKTRTDDTSDLDDLAAVATYQMKVTALTNNYRNYNTKIRLYNLFKNFHDTVKDPLYLAEEIYRMCDVDLIEMYKEFLGFLTVEQAVKIDSFKDYFLQRCVRDIIKRVEQEVSEKDKRHKILTQLDTVIRQTYLRPCEMCQSLLGTMDGLPSLARYVFSLFPHRTVGRKEESNSLQGATEIQNQQIIPATSVEIDQQNNSLIINIQQQQPCTETSKEVNKEQQTILLTNEEVNVEQETTQGAATEGNTDLQSNADTTNATEDVNLEDSRQLARELEEELDQAEDALTICEDTQNMDYEADHSSCGENDNLDTDMESVVEQSTLENTALGSIIIKLEYENDENPESDTTTFTINKTEVVDSEIDKMVTIPEEESVKTEAQEWRREEDKLILEVLTQHLTPEDRKDKTILDIMEEKNLYQMLAESLTTKSLEDIKDRVIYLLEILVLSEY